MNETGACQSGYSVFGIRPVAELARDLIEAPRPRLSVEQKARDRVVDLLLWRGQCPAARLEYAAAAWEGLPFRARPRAVGAAPGPLNDSYSG
jgi:hypothetical protein